MKKQIYSTRLVIANSFMFITMSVFSKQSRWSDKNVKDRVQTQHGHP